jgi:hypothetical protein
LDAEDWRRICFHELSISCRLNPQRYAGKALRIKREQEGRKYPKIYGFKQSPHIVNWQPG